MKYALATENRGLRMLNGLLKAAWATRFDAEIEGERQYMSALRITHEGRGYKVEFEMENENPKFMRALRG